MSDYSFPFYSDWVFAFHFICPVMPVGHPSEDNLSQSGDPPQAIGGRMYKKSIKGKKSISTLDMALIVSFCIFGFTALVFEPLYYFGCDWNFHTCTHELTWPIIRMAKSIWEIYCEWDPMFYNIPDWLRVLSCIEVFVFGPLYGLCAYGLWNPTHTGSPTHSYAPWLPWVALPFCGALLYSTMVYFAMEVLYPMEGTNLSLVFAINLPWSIGPVVLAYRLICMGESRPTSASKAKAAKTR